MRETTGPREKQAHPVSAENPIPRRTFAATAAYPPEALAIAAAGHVDLVVTLDEIGRIAEIRKVTNASAVSAQLPASQAAVRAAVDAFMREAAGALQRWIYDPPARGPVRFTVTFSFEQGIEPTSREIAAVPAIRVGSKGGPVLVKRVRPIYPAAAQRARVRGMVILEIRVGADGKVSDAKVLRSVPLLDQAALGAVRQWEYNPTMLAGEFIPVVMTAALTFP